MATKGNKRVKAFVIATKSKPVELWTNEINDFRIKCYTIFPSEKQASEWKSKSDGYNDTRVVPCTITYSTGVKK